MRGVAIRWSGHTPTAFKLGVRPVAGLIDSPNLFSVVVAVLAAIVGVVSLAFQDWNRAGGSALQLLLNVDLLILVGAAALRVQRLIWSPRARRGSA
jgi:hypothetical protein